MENKNIELTYQSPSLGRVFLSHVLDIFVYLLVTFSLIVAFHQFIPKTKSYKTQNDAIDTIRVESHLYVGTIGGAIYDLPTYLDGQGLPADDISESLDSAMSYFFTVYINEELDHKGEETYLSFKKDASIKGEKMFSSTGERLLVSNDYDGNYLDFYKNTYKNKAIGYLSYKKGFDSARIKLTLIEIGWDVLCALIAASILYLVIPLCFSRGKKTLGFLCSRLSYVDGNGLSPKLPRMIAYFSFQFLAILLLSVLTFLIPIFISIGMMAIRKQRQTFAEYVCNLFPVINEDNKIYVSSREANREVQAEE